MAYGELKVDSITFTNGGADTTVSVSGLVQNPTFSGDITVTGTISGDVVQGGTLVSGATVSGTAGEFGTVTGNTAGFTTVTGTTVTGTTSNFVSGVFTTQISGITITGNAGQFSTITGNTVGFTTVTGATVTGTTANFVTVSGTTVTGNAAQFTTLTGGTAGFTTVTGNTITGGTGQFTSVTGNTAGFTTVTGTTVTGTTANFATLSGTTVTGGTGQFTSLTSTTATITSGVFASGTAAAPSVSVGTTDNGLYSPGTDQVALSTNGTGRLFVDASGNVGVAQPTPTAALHVYGTPNTTVRIEDQGEYLDLTYNDNGSTVSIGSINADNGDSSVGSTELRIGVDNESRYVIYADGTHQFLKSGGVNDAMRITSAGLVGIGTSSPSTLLHLQSSTNNILFLESSDSVADIIGADTTGSTRIRSVGGELSLWTGGDASSDNAASASQNVTIDSSGNVGIGTTSPGANLEIGTPSGSDTSIKLNSSTNDYLELSSQDTVGYITAGHPTTGGGVLGFKTASGGATEERARIDSSGRLLVGTSSWSGSNLLTIQGNTSNSTGAGELFLARGESAADMSSGDSVSRVSFGDQDDNDYAGIECQVDGTPAANDYPGRLVFSTTADGASSPTEQLRITSDRYVRLASGSGGIQFNGDTASANALDDYEEGTWTPVVEGTTTAGTGTYSVQQGNYTKIGDTVFVQGYVVWTAHTGTGNLRIASLPFTSNPASQYRAPVTLGYVRDLAITAGTQLTAQLGQNTTYIGFFEVPHGGGNPTSVAMDAAAYIAFSVTYKL